MVKRDLKQSLNACLDLAGTIDWKKKTEESKQQTLLESIANNLSESLTKDFGGTFINDGGD
jgi:hypothetical protein